MREKKCQQKMCSRIWGAADLLAAAIGMIATTQEVRLAVLPARPFAQHLAGEARDELRPAPPKRELVVAAADVITCEPSDDRRPRGPAQVLLVTLAQLVGAFGSFFPLCLRRLPGLLVHAPFCLSPSVRHDRSSCGWVNCCPKRNKKSLQK